MKFFTSVLFLIAFVSCISYGQNTGDYQSAASGPSNIAATWQVYNGTSWVTPGVSTTGTTTAGSTVITSVASTTGMIVGMMVSGTGIPGNPITTITAIDAVDSTLTISAPTIASGTLVALSVGASPSPQEAVTIQAGHIITMESTTSWGNLTINGTLSMGKANNTTNRTLTINGSITVNPGGVLQPNVNTTTLYNQKHYIYLNGDVVNNGTITGYLTNATFGTVKMTMIFTKNGNASFSGTPQNPTSLQELTVNLGTSITNVLTVSQNIICGSSSATTAGGLFLTNGSIALSPSDTIKYGSNATLTYNCMTYAQTTSDAELPAVGGPKGITISNPNGLTLHAIRTIPGTVTLTSGTLASNGNYFIYGPTGSLTYNNGAAMQTTSDVEFPAVNGPSKLTVNNSHGLTLHADRTLTSTLVMTAGNIILNGINLTLGTSSVNPGILTYTAGYFTGTGKFKRWFGPVAISGTAGVFPFGSGSNNRSLTIGGIPTTGGNLSVTYADSTTVSAPFGQTGFTDSVFTFMHRYDASWTVAKGDSLTGTGFTLGINGNGINNIDSLIHINMSGATGPAPGQYSHPTGALAAPVINRIGLTDSTLFSTYYFASTIESSLPVELTDYTASVNGSNVNLNWKTSTELNNKGFEILRAGSDNVFHSICFIDGKGNSESVIKYSYTDKRTGFGIFRYKLKQLDYNGNYKYSKILEINIIAPARFSLSQNYPNPFNPATTINFEIPKASHITLVVFNALGQKVATMVDEFLNPGYYHKSFDGSGLATGMYVYRLTSDAAVITKKMVLIK